MSSAAESSGNKAYPAPLASHDDVVKDGSLFWETLRSFHRAMAKRYTIPVIGGKELDLHVLYIEVTKRGGFQKVVTMKKWREVSSVFMFPGTTTSASYALRKHYSTLLHDYENVYFPHPKPPNHPPHISSDHSTFEAIGRIEAKFEYGYIVTLKLESETLRGVLYHSSIDDQQRSAMIPCDKNSLGSGPSNERRRRRKRRNKSDPARPKPNRSGYNFYFAEKHAKLKSQYPLREREFTQMIGRAWNNLSHEEKLVYQKQGQKDKERYRRELAEYKERLKGMRQGQDA